jgi:hypothetical protein
VFQNTLKKNPCSEDGPEIGQVQGVWESSQIPIDRAQRVTGKDS